MSRLLLPVALLLTLGLITSCGGGGSGVGAPVTEREETSVIGQAGGTLAFPGEVSLAIPASAVPDSTNAALRLRSRPFEESPAATNYASGIEIELSQPPADNAEFSLSLKASAVDGELGWTAALSTADGLRFPAHLPKRLSSTQVEVRIKGSEFSQAVTPSGASVWRVQISPAVAHQALAPLAADPLYKSSRPDGSFRLSANVIVPVEGAESLAGKHVAIILHGLNNSAGDATDTAYLAQEAAKQSAMGSYSAIWLFEYYDSALGIAANGKRLADALRAHGILDAGHVDLYGHSMGGLVSRWAIEHEGLGAVVDRLITLGTPHKGVPDEVMGNVLWHVLHLSGGIGDLEEHSAFITALNATPSPYKDKLLYCTLVGKNALYFGQFGLNVEQHYRERGYTGPVDGIVAGYSAAPDNLMQFGVSPPSASAVLDLNHSNLGGKLGSDQPGSPNALVLAEFVRFLNATVDGSIG